LFFYNLDELDLTFSCLDRFLGVPSTIMMEPSSVLQMLSVPLFLTDFIIRHGTTPSTFMHLDSFSAYLADAYADPRHHVILMRALVAVLVSLAPVLMFAICRKMGVDRLASVFFAAILSLHPAFFGQSLLAAGDSLGFTAVLGAVLVLFHIERGNAAISLAGFLYGMAVAFKFTMASSLVILLAIMWAWPTLRHVRGVVISLTRLGIGIVAGILLWWPFVWVEPLRTAKSIFGNVNKVGSHPDMVVFFEKLRESAGTAFVLFMIVSVLASLYAFRRSPAKRLVLALLCSILVVSVPLVMKATSAYPRYFIPLALPPILCFALLTVNAPRFSVAFLALLSLAMAATVIQQQRSLRTRDELTTALKLLRHLSSESRVYLPEDAALTYTFRLPQSTYERISAHARDELNQRKGIFSFLRLHGVSEKSIRILATDFNEDEQANAAHTAAAAESSANPLHVPDVYLYRTSGTDRTSWASIDQATAIDLFRASPPAAILVRSKEVQLGGAWWRGSQWTWYTNPSAIRSDQ
jgi:hypothetical protein